MNSLKGLFLGAAFGALMVVPAVAWESALYVSPEPAIQPAQIDDVNQCSLLTSCLDDSGACDPCGDAVSCDSCGACDPCDAGCGGCGCGCGGLLGDICLWSDADEFSLFGTTCSGITVGGWLQAGFYNYNTGMFNNNPDRLNVNQMYLFSEKALSGGNNWDWGYRADYVYGTDGPDTQAFGNPPGHWDNGWTNGSYGHAIPQLYVELGRNDFSLKLGKFYTILGYETVTAPDNFFYSHAFTMYYAEPFTHTGALATYKTAGGATLYGGWTTGWDTGYDEFGGNTFLGGISFDLCDRTTCTYALTFGEIGFGTNADGYSHSIVFDTQLTDRLNWVFQTDYMDYNGVVNDVRAGVPLGTLAIPSRYGVNNYLFYNINECLDAGIRFEWFNAEVAPGARADLYEMTAGLNYKPHPNFIVRPEIRWDKDDTGRTIPAARNDTVGFGMDMILTF